MRLNRIAAWCHRRRWQTLGLWIAGLVLVGGIGNTLAADTEDDFAPRCALHRRRASAGQGPRRCGGPP
jgi:hypothetical protein